MRATVTRHIPTNSRIRSELPPPVEAEVGAGAGAEGPEGSSASRPDRRCWPVTTCLRCAFFRASEVVEEGEVSSVVCDCCWTLWPELPEDDGVECCVTGSWPDAVGTLSTYSFGAELVSLGDGAGVLGSGVDVVGTEGVLVGCVVVPEDVGAAVGVVVWASALPPRPSRAAQARLVVATCLDLLSMFT